MDFNTIIAIGDLHGDFRVFVNVLLMCNLINDEWEWIAGDTYVVQLGDTLDGKRPETKIENTFLQESGEIEIMRLILTLDCQAKKYGGRVISLLGNHELYPYYLPNDKQFIRGYVKTKDIEQFKKIYNTDRIKFLKPGGIGGSLMGRTRPLILKLGEFLFIHGSVTDKLIKNNLNPETGKVDIAKINRETSLWMQGKGKIPKCLEEMDEENPVFSRMYSNSKTFNEQECAKFDNQLKFFDGVNYVIMGHSRFKTINTACNRSLIRTDVSLSRAFGGNLSNKSLQALEIIQYKNKPPVIRVITKDGKINLS
tara:strand:+ start:7265 stop:8194 length:930 start_codon:yes stop_codon:yes gene_type:complete